MDKRFVKGSKEAKAHMAKLRAKRSVAGVKKKAVKKAVNKTRQTGTSDKRIDKRVQAKQPGVRKSATGKKYSERRANRSDKGVLLGIGAVKKDLSGKYKLTVDSIAYLSGEIAMNKIFLQHAAVAQRPVFRQKIKALQILLKEARSLKVKLSKFK